MIRFFLPIVILLSIGYLVLSEDKYVEYELNICERKLLKGDWDIQSASFIYKKPQEYEKPFIVICGFSGSASGWEISNNETHNIYNERGEYFGTDTVIKNSKKIKMKCYPDKVSIGVSNKDYSIKGYPGACTFPYNRGVEYAGPIYDSK